LSNRSKRCVITDDELLELIAVELVDATQGKTAPLCSNDEIQRLQKKIAKKTRK